MSFHSFFPSATLSNWFSIFAVKSTFITSLKFSINNEFTTFPNSVGTSCFLSFSIYLLSNIVVIIGEYVLGLPISFSSNALTRLASVYLGGGSVKLCFVSIFLF